MNYGIYGEKERMRDKFPLINRRNIHPARYTQSLIAEALRVGLIPIELVDDIQMQIRGILEVCLRTLCRDRMALGEKNAEVVGEEEAKTQLDSIFYSLDTYLLGFHDPMYAINALEAMCADDMYREGQKALRALILETVALSVQAKRTRITTDNDRYNRTLDEDIRAYLNGYDYRTAGHKIVIAPSYSLADDVGGVQGIHYLCEYLKCLLLENRFLALFDGEEKNLLFRSYAAKNGTSTRKMNANLFTVTVNNALGASLLGKYTGILTLTAEEVQTLYGMLYRKTTRELEHMTASAVRTMTADLKPIPSVAAYLNAQAKKLAARLIAARNAKEEAALFVVSDPIELFKL